MCRSSVMILSIFVPSHWAPPRLFYVCVCVCTCVSVCVYMYVCYDITCMIYMLYVRACSLVCRGDFKWWEFRSLVYLDLHEVFFNVLTFADRNIRHNFSPCLYWSLCFLIREWNVGCSQGLRNFFCEDLVYLELGKLLIAVNWLSWLSWYFGHLNFTPIG